MATGESGRIVSTSRELREKYFLERCSVICLNIDLKNECTTQLQTIIKDIRNDTNVDECIDFITDLEHQNVLLIMEESVGMNIISRIHDIDQINGIYLYRIKKKQCSQGIRDNCPKYKGVIDTFASLSYEVECFVKRFQRDIVTINLITQNERSTVDESSVIEKNENFIIDEASFMYFDITLQFLLKLSEDNPNDLIEFSRMEYSNNESILKTIDELEKDYRNHTPIWWYTKEGFLYKILNKALREQNAIGLYHFRMFINDLNKQLLQLFDSQFTTNSTNSSEFTLYRGQQMKYEILEKIKRKVGSFFSFTSFLSTTTNKNLALIYAGNTNDNENLAAVLFQLSIDANRINCPFAKIDSLSYFGQVEEEYLFSMGSVFKIEEIEKQSDEVWLIQLRMTDQYELKLKEVAEDILDRVEDCDPLISLGKVYWSLRNGENANFFYKRALERETDWRRQAMILQDLGTVSSVTKNNQEALNYFNQSLEILQQHPESKCDSSYSSIYNNIGAIYGNMEEYELAMVFLKESINHELCRSQSDKLKLATRYTNIGMLLLYHDQVDKSEFYFHNALNLACEVFPPMHPSLVKYYSIFAEYMSTLGRFVEAVNYEKKAVDICMNSFPTNHPETQLHHNNLAKYKESLEILETIGNMKSPAIGLMLSNGSMVYTCCK